MTDAERGEATPCRRAPFVVVAAWIGIATGGWQCSDLSAHKPGDESVSVPLDKVGSSGSPAPAAAPVRSAPPPSQKSAAKAAVSPSPSTSAAPVPGTPAAAPPVQVTATTLTPRTDPPNEARALSQAFANVARALGPSVVRVDVEVAHPELDDDAAEAGPDPSEVPPQFRRFFQFGQPAEPGPQRGTGSGIVLDGAGDIITNRHVVSHASKVSVTFPDGRELSAKVIGADRQTDVAVVRLDDPPRDLVAARLGDSDKLDVGEWVLAVGSPLGLDQTVTAGIVSGKGRVGRHVQMSGERVRRYIQTDAKINPGNSGGPLVNLGAEVVGINTLINTGPGGAYGFAIPINQVRRVAEALIRDGRVRYPYLGVLLGDVRELAPSKRAALATTAGGPATGALVSEVTPGSPAVRAGLRAGDVITEIDGHSMEGSGDVIDYVSTRTIGAKVMVAYLRDGKKIDVPVVLGELPSRPGDELAAGDDDRTSVLGLSLQTLTPRLAESLGLPTSVRGAVVVEAPPPESFREERPRDGRGGSRGGRGNRTALAAGDVIVEVDRKPVATAGDARAALRTPRRGGHLLRVRGAGGARFVTFGE